MTDLASDLRHGLRALLWEPAFTAVAVVTLALGIGATTAMFSVADAVLLRPLPFPEPERLIAVWSRDARSPQSKQYVSSLDLSDWRAGSESFAYLAGWFTYEFTLAGAGEPLRVKGVGVDGDLFSLLGAAPEIGRGFRPGDDRVVVLAHSLWQRQFGADPHRVGGSILLNGESYTVSGVMPRGFQFPLGAEPVDLWATWDYALHDGPASKRDARVLEAIGRLRAGVPLERARAELEGIATRLSREYPETNENIGVSLVPAIEDLVGGHRRALLVLFGAVGCVLLVACVNVANLLVVRAANRRREMAVRVALGASRTRITLQLLTESLLLALAGGLTGGLLALWGVDVLLALVPGYLPGAEGIGLDGRVLGFALVVSLSTALVSGLAPAGYASKVALTTALKQGGQSGGASGAGRLRAGLVVAELASALVLLTGAGLLVTSYWRLHRVEPGFDSRDVVAFRVSLPYEQYDTARAGAFFETLQDGLRALPGVRAASAAFPLPFSGDPVFDQLDVALDTRLVIDGRLTQPSERPPVDVRTVQADYFRAMGIPLRQGRDFDDADDSRAPPVALINESLARRHFPGEDPLGKRIGVDSVYVQGEPELRRVIGVVADVKHRALGAEARDEVYLPFTQDPFQEMFVVVKTQGPNDPRRLASAVREVVLELDADQPIYDVRTLAERIGRSLAHERFQTLLLVLFSSLALGIAVVGLSSVVAYAAVSRRQELGIRMALGARRETIRRMVLARGMKLVLLGVALGLLGATALTRVLESMLFGVSANDPLVFAGVAALFVATAATACWIPARRATNLDPLIALRCE